jgi:hypothetical protein
MAILVTQFNRWGDSGHMQVKPKRLHSLWDVHKVVGVRLRIPVSSIPPAELPRVRRPPEEGMLDDRSARRVCHGSLAQEQRQHEWW